MENSSDDVMVGDVMSEAISSVARSTPARDAAKMMRDRDIGFLPVCEADGSVVGVLTDRDLVLSVLAADRPVTTPVGEVMTPDPVICHADDDLDWCERLMSENQINRMVVLGDDERLVGVVSLADLTQVEDERAVGDLIADVRQDQAGPR